MSPSKRPALLAIGHVLITSELFFRSFEELPLLPLQLFLRHVDGHVARRVWGDMEMLVLLLSNALLDDYSVHLRFQSFRSSRRIRRS